jgi:hypothetical protein
MEILVTENATSNMVSITDSGIIATPAYVTRTYDPRVLCRQFTDGFDKGQFTETTSLSGGINYTTNSRSGLAQLTSAAGTNNSKAELASLSVANIPLASGELHFSALVQVLSPQTNTTFRMAVGFFASSTPAPSAHAGFRLGTFTSSTVANSSWWISYMSTSGSDVWVNTTADPTSTNILGVSSNSNGTEFYFSVNGAVVLTATDVETDSGNCKAGAFVTSVGTGSVSPSNLQLDYMICDQYLSR